MDAPNVEPQLIARTERRPKLEGPGVFWALIILMLILLALAVVMFGRSEGEIGSNNTLTVTPSPEDRQSRTYTVFYKNGVFSPTNLRIHAGDTVKFKNEGILPIRVISDPHPGHDSLNGFDSIGDMPQNSYFIFTFAAKGVFGYHNEKNINETGTIMVR